EVFAVGVAVDLFQILDPLDVGARLCELDPDAVAPPAVDVVLAGVVGGERGALVTVLLQQVAQVPRSVADVDLRVVQVVDAERGSAGVERNSLGRVRQQLHQANRAGARPRIRLELGLLVDDSSQKGRIEIVVACVTANDLLVVQRVPEPLPPPRLRRLHHDERQQHAAGEHRSRQKAPHAVSLPTTSATKSSSSSSVPSLTYV